LTTVDTDRILGFEATAATDWSIIWSGPGSLSISTNTSQGSRSLAVFSHGYVPVQSVAMPSLGFRVGNVIHYDIMLPSELKQLSPYWYGATQLYVSIPSLGLNNQYLGQVELTPLPLGKWNTLSFTPPSDVLAKLKQGYSDLRTTIVVNAPHNATKPYLIDNLRFGDSTLALVTVLDGSGKPIPGLKVTAYTDSTPTSNTALTDASGLAKILVPPGSYRFGVTEARVTTFSSPGNQCHVPGICVASTINAKCHAVVCSPMDACHDAGTCDPGTGVCSNPEKPGGSVCYAALNLAAQMLGVDQESVGLGEGPTIALPLTGKGPFRRYKAYLRSAGEPNVVGLALDENGEQVDADSLTAAEEAARRAKYGKKTVDLYDRLNPACAPQKVPVTIWLHVPDPNSLPEPRPPAGDGVLDVLSAKAVESRRREAIAAYAASTKDVKDRFLALLRQLDPDARDLGGPEPYFIANLSASDIATVEGNADVDSIDLGDKPPEAQLSHAKVILGYDRIHAPPISITGKGVKIGQIEPSAPLPDPNEIPEIADFTEPDPGVGCPDDKTHMLRVASVMLSNDSPSKGVAPEASLYVGGNCKSNAFDLDVEAKKATDWGAVAINNSWTIPTSVGARPGNYDRFFDSLAFKSRVTVVVPAGNSTDESGFHTCYKGLKLGKTGVVKSPGLGFNVISVGGADSPESMQYKDLWPCSAWKDPGSHYRDRNKPEVIAPAWVNTLTICPRYGKYFSTHDCDYNPVDGTSLSAPFVTASAALLVQAQPVVADEPELIKAILMASSQPLPNSGKDRYGAGLINIGAAVDIIRGVNGNWRAATPPGCSGPWPFRWPMYLVAGRQTRVAIAWSQDPNYDNYNYQPQADLDLWVLNEQGYQFQREVGNSWDNNYEFIDFVPPETGTYTIQVTKYRCDYHFVANRIGLAWYQVP